VTPSASAKEITVDGSPMQEKTLKVIIPSGFNEKRQVKDALPKSPILFASKIYDIDAVVTNSKRETDSHIDNRSLNMDLEDNEVYTEEK
jgi:hypothetical protein